MILTEEEIRIILRELGGGYSEKPEVAKVQAKLSMMLEAKMRVAEMKDLDL